MRNSRPGKREKRFVTRTSAFRPSTPPSVAARPFSAGRLSLHLEVRLPREDLLGQLAPARGAPDPRVGLLGLEPGGLPLEKRRFGGFGALPRGPAFDPFEGRLEGVEVVGERKDGPDGALPGDDHDVVPLLERVGDEGPERVEEALRTPGSGR
jgi:hypothetical protein